MGIKFACPACGRSLNIKSELAGKRGRCPHCQEKIEIPTESLAPSAAITAAPDGSWSKPVKPRTNQETPAATAAAAPVVAVNAATLTAAGTAGAAPAPVAPAGAQTFAAGDPIAEAPDLQWYVLPPGATSQYGPAVGEGFRAWIQEGRVAADAMVWRQDWTEWKRAGTVFPHLDVGRVASGGMSVAGAAIPTAAGAMPTATGAIPTAAPVLPGPMPAGGPASGAFPIDPLGSLAPASASIRAGHRTYRPRSNTGPIIAIVVLLVAMIPLSILVVKVVRDQFAEPPPASSPDNQE